MDEVARVSASELPDDELFAIVQGRITPASGRPDRRDALSQLFARYHARVHGQCARLLGDDASADDATQEVFLSLLEKPVRYEGRQYFGSWLYIVVRNHCLNVRRKRQREVQDDEVVDTWASLLVDPGDPDRELQDLQLSTLLEEVCADHLTAREREVIHLRYVWGMRVKEIGRALDLENVSGARTHLATAHRKLRDALRERIGERELRLLFGEG